MSAAMLQVRNLKCGYNGREIVHGATFDVEAGEFVCILGANGCGKSTTLKTILGLLPALGGEVLMDGAETLGLREMERARLFAYIPQAHTPPFPFSVHDVVMMGRTPYVGAVARAGKEDEAIVWAAMERLGIDELAGEPYTNLSGGQQQLVLIARALAQQPRVLVMDEPTASLDFGNQQVVLRQMRNLTGEGKSVLMVTHDPAHALLCANRVVLMEGGAVSAQDTAEAVVTSENLQRLYGADVEVVEVVSRGRVQRVCLQLP